MQVLYTLYTTHDTHDTHYTHSPPYTYYTHYTHYIATKLGLLDDLDGEVSSEEANRRHIGWGDEDLRDSGARDSRRSSRNSGIGESIGKEGEAIDAIRHEMLSLCEKLRIQCDTASSRASIANDLSAKVASLLDGLAKEVSIE